MTTDRSTAEQLAKLAAGAITDDKIAPTPRIARDAIKSGRIAPIETWIPADRAALEQLCREAEALGDLTGQWPGYFSGRKLPVDCA